VYVSETTCDCNGDGVVASVGARLASTMASWDVSRCGEGVLVLDMVFGVWIIIIRNIIVIIIIL
jgi:hypothetical protein